MKKLLVLLAASTLALTTASMKADTLSATLDVGAGANAIVGVPGVGGVLNYTYTNSYLALVPGGGLLGLPSLDLFNVDFTATFANVLGIGVLNITDVCIDVSLGNKIAACPGLTFSFSDVTLGPANLLSVLGAASANVTAGVANFTIADASIGGGSASFNFPGGPGGGGDGGGSTPSPVPEPGTLSMMATGLLSAAGVVRRKMKA